MFTYFISYTVRVNVNGVNMWLPENCEYLFEKYIDSLTDIKHIQEAIENDRGVQCQVIINNYQLLSGGS